MSNAEEQFRLIFDRDMSDWDEDVLLPGRQQTKPPCGVVRRTLTRLTKAFSK